MAPSASTRPCRGSILRVWSLAALAVMAPTFARADVVDYLGRMVVSVSLQSEGREVADPALLAVVETHVGRPFAMAEVRESITHLFASGRFENVSVHAAALGGGVTVRFELAPIHPVDRVSFTGADGPGVDVGGLRAAVRERGGASPAIGRAGDLAGVVEAELRRRGYLRAAVTPRAEARHAPDRATLVFVVALGARTTVGRIEITGQSGVTPAALLKQLGLSSGMAYVRDDIESRIDRYLQDRRGRGHVAAALTISPTFRDDDRVVDLTVHAEEGPRVRLAFTGDPVPASRQTEFVPIVREGSADEDLLEDSSNRIRDFLRAQGYRDAVAPYSREQTGDELVITFAVAKGRLYRVGRVNVTGAAAPEAAALLAELRVRAGAPFTASNLDADVQGLQAAYRRLGYTAAQVRSTVEPGGSGGDSGGGILNVRLDVDEGPRTVVGTMRIETGGDPAAPELLDQLALRPGRPYVPADLAADRDRIEAYYANLGYQEAEVDVAPGITADRTRADVVYTVRTGLRAMVDHVIIVGNVRTRTSTIERELRVKSGDALSAAAVTDAQRRLTELGLFRRTRVTQVAHGDAARRDLLVTVEEAPPMTIGYGGGVEAGQYFRTDGNSPVAVQHLEFAPRAFFEIGRRNLFGGTRSVNLFSRLSLRPQGGSTSATGTTGGGRYGFNEYRVLGTYREPHAFGTTADAFLTAVIEQQRRASFNFARRSFGAQIGRRLSPHLSLSGNYQIQRTTLFDVRIAAADKLLVDRLFPQVRLSSFSSALIRDTRDDTLNPSGGANLSANVQLAGRAIGSEVGLLKQYYTAQWFHVVPHAGTTVLATSARLGVASGFPRQAIDEQGNVTVVRDLPASERFFAGGDTTVRGFALDQLGTASTIDSDGFPIGGNGLVILNAELRVPVRKSLGLVGFVDAGNVFARRRDSSLGDLRTAVGFGIRYNSPVGPIRVDLGFKLDRRDIVTGRSESRTALHISLGQAF